MESRSRWTGMMWRLGRAVAAGQARLPVRRGCDIRDGGRAVRVDNRGCASSASPASDNFAPEIRVIQPSSWRVFPEKMGSVFEAQAQVGSMVVSFETGKLARFASGAVVAGVKETKVLATVVSETRLDSSANFLPLQVEYREKNYAKGRIPNTFMRREGAPKERELLCARVVDRSIRPLFPKGYYFETQIIANVLCSDGELDPDLLAVNAASAALMCSDVPWNGPIGAVRIGRVKGKFVVNPDMDELSESDLSLIYSCTAEKTVMIETQAREISNEDLIAALRLAHSEAVKLIPAQYELSGKVCNRKRDVQVFAVSASVLEKVRCLAAEHIKSILDDPGYGKFERGRALSSVQDDVKAVLATEGDDEGVKQLPAAFDQVKKQLLRDNIFERGVRVDGRTLTDVREIYCEAGTYSTLHGSSVFSRGNTQVLCSVTLGSNDDVQRLDSLVGPTTKSFFVHYSFPPFSINEVGRLGGMNRREVGHGTLAEKALVAVLPPEDESTFSVRVASEVMASDGSSSMATVCGGSLALMDAGVQLERHVAGVSMGLVSLVDPETGNFLDYRILTDILGLEDHLGDMDFKIAGTKQGVTGIQLDIKLKGIPLDILCECLEPALVARSYIIEEMEKVLKEPRKEQKENTPRKGSTTIERDAVRVLIGPLGATVKNIQNTTGAKLHISEDGLVTIFAQSQAGLDEAKEMIEAAVGNREIVVGGTYTGTIMAIKDFGAFVEFKNKGHQGLLHISELEHRPVSRVTDVVSVGEEVQVMCIGRDLRGNIKLSRKAVLPPPGEAEAVSKAR